MNTYYIVIEATIKTLTEIRDVIGWSIRNTENNMDTSVGLKNEIEAIEKERGYPIVIKYWKQLDLS